MEQQKDKNPTEKIEELINTLTGWKKRQLEDIRNTILRTKEGIIEEWKWETPVWSYKGSIVSACVFKDHVKLNFFQGARLEEYKSSFNARFDAKKSRGIDYFEKDTVDQELFKKMVLAAITINESGIK